MAEQEQKPQFGCPKCKGTDIEENNTVFVALPVLAWEDDGEPADFGPWRIIDDTISTFDPDKDGPRWHCGDCCEDFETLLNLTTGLLVTGEKPEEVTADGNA